MSDETGTTATQTDGLSDTAAGSIAYITWIPAVIFLLIDPYKNKPFVKFHCIQNLGLNIAAIGVYFCMFIVSFVLAFIPFLRFLVLLIYPVVGLALLVVWILCILKASQGSAFKLPVISDFASKQSGYSV